MNEILKDINKDVQILQELLDENRHQNELFQERMVEGLKNLVVQEEIQEAPGFEGTMDALDKLTI